MIQHCRDLPKNDLRVLAWRNMKEDRRVGWENSHQDVTIEGVGIFRVFSHGAYEKLNEG